jgi:hypothetical protein
LTTAERELSLIKNVILKTKTILSDTIRVVLRARNFGEEGCLALCAKLKVFDDEEVHPSSLKVFDEHFEDFYQQLFSLEVDILRSKHLKARQLTSQPQKPDLRGASSSLNRSHKELRGILHSIPAPPKHNIVSLKPSATKPYFYLPIQPNRPAEEAASKREQPAATTIKRSTSSKSIANTSAKQLEPLDLKDSKVAPFDLRTKK